MKYARALWAGPAALAASNLSVACLSWQLKSPASPLTPVSCSWHLQSCSCLWFGESGAMPAMTAAAPKQRKSCISELIEHDKEVHDSAGHGEVGQGIEQHNNMLILAKHWLIDMRQSYDTMQRRLPSQPCDMVEGWTVIVSSAPQPHTTSYVHVQHLSLASHHVAGN